MSSVPETITYAKKITEKEYNEQKDDYTQKALKELNEQMKTFIKPQSNTNTLISSNKKISLSLPNSDNDDNDNDNDYESKEDKTKDHDSDSDYTEHENSSNTTKSNSSLNFIIKHYVNEQVPPQQQLLKKRKITNTNKDTKQQTQHVNTMSDAIYAQHELDMDVITKLKLKNNTLKVENEDLDTKKHFLTLELSNAQCEVSDLKKQISVLKNENINLIKYIKVMKRHDDLFDFYIKIVAYIIIFLTLLVIYTLL